MFAPLSSPTLRTSSGRAGPRRPAGTTPIDEVLIVVPAHNEQDHIESCLESIRVAVRGVDVPVTTVVVADRCCDGTVERAVEVLRGGSTDVVLVTLAGGAGAARRAGTTCALMECVTPYDRVWIANTDADTTVGPDWISTQLSFARQGFVGVAGVVRLAPTEPLAAAFDRSYRIEPDGTHGHVHGANIGFRADVHLAVGGWNALESGEDHDLWNRLRVYGPVIATASLTVNTSGRLVGRAPDGFASDLVELAAAERIAAGS